jgi:RNA polymerase sigma-B factor
VPQETSANDGSSAEPGELTDEEASRARDEAEARALFAEYQRTGDRAIRNQLIERYRRLAEFLARRFTNRGEPLDDLRQVAFVGLLKAVERFDPSRGLQFSSFATPTINGELKRYFRDKGWAVHVPRRLQELHLQLDRTTADLNQELGRPPTPGEIAARAGVTVEDILEGMEAGGMYRLAPLDAGSDEHEGAGATVGERDAEIDAVDDRVVVERLLQALPERERHIVFLRFFEGRTQAEIADTVGISQMHVSRLLMKSLEALGDRARHLSASSGTREPQTGLSGSV